MRRSLFLFFLIHFSFFGVLKAQMDLPNPGFEEWDSIPGLRPYWEPKYYNSKCGAFQNSNRIYIFKSTESHSGNFSLLLTPAIDSNETFTNYNSWIQLDSLKNRQIELNTQPNYFSLPLIGLPKKVSGWYKYIPDTTTYFPSIAFTPGLVLNTGVEYNGTSTFCGRAAIGFLEPQGEFTYFSVPVNDECPPFTPTFYSLFINFPSKNKLMNPAGKLWLDDLEIEYETTSVDGRKKNSFVVFPNPGNQEIRIVGLSGNEKISLQNGQGKTLMEKQAEGEMEFKLETFRLPSGMYFLSVEKNGQKEVQKWVKI